MHQQHEVGAADSAWTHVYVRSGGRWKLVSQGWTSSGHMAAQAYAQSAGGPVYVVKWSPTTGRLVHGLYKPAPAWVPVADGRATGGGQYRWSAVGAATSAEMMKAAKTMGFVDMKAWPKDSTPPDDWPAEDRDPSRVRMEGTLPSTVIMVRVPQALVWKRDTPSVARTWVRMPTLWLGGGGIYRLSGSAAHKTVQEIAANMAKHAQLRDIKSWGPNDPLPEDWPAEDREPGRNRFQATVGPGAPPGSFPSGHGWAWSLPRPMAAAGPGKAAVAGRADPAWLPYAADQLGKLLLGGPMGVQTVADDVEHGGIDVYVLAGYADRFRGYVVTELGGQFMGFPIRVHTSQGNVIQRVALPG